MGAHKLRERLGQKSVLITAIPVYNSVHDLHHPAENVERRSAFIHVYRRLSAESAVWKFADESKLGNKNIQLVEYPENEICYYNLHKDGKKLLGPEKGDKKESRQY